jgi:hypothetical protein
MVLNRINGIPEALHRGKDYGCVTPAQAIQYVADLTSHHKWTVAKLFHAKHGQCLWASPDIDASLVEFMRAQSKKGFWLSAGMCCCHVYNHFKDGHGESLTVGTRNMRRHVRRLGWEWSDVAQPTKDDKSAKKKLKEDPFVRRRAAQFICQKSVSLHLQELGYVIIKLDESYYLVTDVVKKALQEGGKAQKKEDGTECKPPGAKSKGRFCMMMAITDEEPLAVRDVRPGWRERYEAVQGRKWAYGDEKLWCMPDDAWSPTPEQGPVQDDTGNCMYMFHTGVGKPKNAHVSRFIEAKNWFPWFKNKVMAVFNTKHSGSIVIVQKDNVGYSLTLDEKAVRPADFNRAQCVEFILTHCFPRAKRSADDAPMLHREGIRGLSIRRTDKGERVSEDRTGQEWSTTAQVKKTLRAGGPDIKEMREFIKYFMYKYRPECVNKELYNLIGKGGLLLLTPEHLSYLFNKAIEEYWSQQKGGTRRSFFVGRSTKETKIALLDSAFGRNRDGGINCADLTRHELQVLREIMESDTQHFITCRCDEGPCPECSTIKDLKFTYAAQHCSVLGPGVKLYRRAVITNDVASWLAAFDAFQPVKYHTVYQRKAGEYVDSESDSDDEE